MVYEYIVRDRHGVFSESTASYEKLDDHFRKVQVDFHFCRYFQISPCRSQDYDVTDKIHQQSTVTLRHVLRTRRGLTTLLLYYYYTCSLTCISFIEGRFTVTIPSFL